MTTDAAGMHGLRDHPLRASLSSEMHERKLPPLTTPSRVMQILFAVPNEQVDQERQLLDQLLSPTEGGPSKAKYRRATRDGVHVVWERHTEVSSYTFICPGSADSAFDPADFDVLPAGWLERIPGEVIRATQVAILESASPSLVERSFAAEYLVHCDVFDGRGSIWSDFRLNDDRFGRLLIVDNGMTANELSLCTQRMQDLGNYRNLVLLGLPVAQSLAPRLTELEQALAVTTEQIADRSVTDERLLASLSDLSADVARIVASSHYRMSASRAYVQIVDDRLRSLRVVRIPGHQTLTDFTERRLLPAARTCDSFASRLDELSQRVAWTSGLLRTRVDTELSTQNRDLLESMNRRTAMQLRLQQTVEGLSVVAITYYSIALLSHVLDGFEFAAPFTHDRIIAIAVPIVALLVGWGLIRAHHRLKRDTPDRNGHTG